MWRKIDFFLLKLLVFFQFHSKIDLKSSKITFYPIFKEKLKVFKN